MKLNAAFDEMELVLNELNEQFETIKKNEVRVPQIEIDIMMASIRRLYERVSHLNNQKELPVAEKTEVIDEQKTNSPQTEPVADLVPEQKVDFIEETSKFEEDLSYEKITSDFLEEIESQEGRTESEWEDNEILELEEVEAEVKQTSDEKPNKEAPKASLLLQFEDEIFSVNETLAQKTKDKSLVNKLSNTRIENLKSAIGINDKFYFINELFSGNSQAYEDVIYALNNFKRFEEAMQYFSTLKYRYDWNTEADAYQKLVHFLERKFIQMHV